MFAEFTRSARVLWVLISNVPGDHGVHYRPYAGQLHLTNR